MPIRAFVGLSFAAKDARRAALEQWLSAAVSLAGSSCAWARKALHRFLRTESFLLRGGLSQKSAHHHQQPHPQRGIAPPGGTPTVTVEMPAVYTSGELLEFDVNGQVLAEAD